MIKIIYFETHEDALPKSYFFDSDDEDEALEVFRQLFPSALLIDIKHNETTTD